MSNNKGGKFFKFQNVQIVRRPNAGRQTRQNTQINSQGSAEQQFQSIQAAAREEGILLHGGPPSDFWFCLDDEKRDEGHMVRVKTKPRHATVRPPKCVVYMSHNPIRYSIHRHRELFQKDEDARVKKKQLELYKKYVHTPPTEDSATTTPQKTSHS